MEIVIVTYSHELKKAYQLINDIQAVEYLRKFKIHLIVNDDVETYKICQERFLKFNTVQVYHFESLGHSCLFNFQNGWLHQQVLKLTISKIISTDWYLILDSDFRINISNADKLDHDFFFEDSKAVVDLVQISQINKTFNRYAHNVFEMFNVPITEHSVILKENPPILLRTKYVKRLLKNINLDHCIMNNQTCEFYLYWAYLVANQLDTKFYQMQPQRDISRFFYFSRS